ncbi:unnamed protein product [Caretta caretta]
MLSSSAATRPPDLTLVRVDGAASKLPCCLPQLPPTERASQHPAAPAFLPAGQLAFALTQSVQPGGRGSRAADSSHSPTPAERKVGLALRSPPRAGAGSLPRACLGFLTLLPHGMHLTANPQLGTSLAMAKLSVPPPGTG